MNLANVKVEYSCGTTITDRVTLDPATGQVHLAPRLQALLRAMEETECSPSFVVEYNGSTLPVTVDSNGLRKVSSHEPLRLELRTAQHLAEHRTDLSYRLAFEVQTITVRRRVRTCARNGRHDAFVAAGHADGNRLLVAQGLHECMIHF